jgi:aspartyl protease family protein
VNGDDAPRALYLLLLLMLVASSLVGMRLPLAKATKMVMAWIAIFGVAFALFAFRDEFSSLGQRLRAEATGAPIATGEELRIPISEDGHYWVEARVNGHAARFLVDSGASITTVSQATADAAALRRGMQVAQVETANGTVSMGRGTAERFEVGDIERRDFAVHINPRDGVNVIGMNFLSKLASWRVEGNYLVLRA